MYIIALQCNTSEPENSKSCYVALCIPWCVLKVRYDKIPMNPTHWDSNHNARNTLI